MIIQYMRQLAREILTNADIALFCQQKYGKALTLLIGEDPRNLPSIDNCPMVVFSISGRQVEIEDASLTLVSRQLKIGIAVNSESSSMVKNSDGAFENVGFEDFENFISIIQRVVHRFQDPEGIFSTNPINGPEDSIEPPVYKAFIGQTVTYESEIFEGA